MLQCRDCRFLNDKISARHHCQTYSLQFELVFFYIFCDQLELVLYLKCNSNLFSVGAQYEVEPRTSVPLSGNLPGVSVWTDLYDHYNLRNDNGLDDDGRRSHGSRFGRARRHRVIRRAARRDSAPPGGRPRGIPVLPPRRDNYLYCTATDRRSGIRHVDYFTINKI
jgi:hypothetical protein